MGAFDLRSGGERPLQWSALGAMRRSALGARGFFIPEMSCAPGALRLAFAYHFVLASGVVSWPGLSFSAFVWCSPSVNFVLIRSGSVWPLRRSALGAKCRFTLGARGLFIDPLWVRCVGPLWERGLPRVRGLREQLLASGSVTFRDMQSFIGKCGGLSLVFPAILRLIWGIFGLLETRGGPWGP